MLPRGHSWVPCPCGAAEERSPEEDTPVGIGVISLGGGGDKGDLSVPVGTSESLQWLKFYCLRQGTSKRGEGRPFLSCRGWKAA